MDIPSAGPRDQANRRSGWIICEVGRSDVLRHRRGLFGVGFQWGAAISFETLVAQLGLPFLFIGAGTEGEAVAVAGGALAHRGLLPLWEVGLAVLGGSLAQGQILFLVGRYLRGMAWVQSASRGPAYARVIRGLERHPVGLVLGFRFLFGLRSLTPLVIGTSNVSAVRFALLNLIGAVIWAATFVGLGFAFGTGIEHVFGHLPVHIHLPAVVAIAVVLLVGIWLWRRSRRGRIAEVV